MKPLFQLILFISLFTGCTKTEPEPSRNLPEASFTYTNLTKGMVEFGNTSKFAEEHLWDFGDGNTSKEINAKHTYLKNGEYKVSLTVSNAHGKNSITQTINVTDLNFAVANFGHKVTRGTVTFTDSSKYAQTYAWDFGDGKSSTDKQPIHTYDKNGEYKVSLTVTNDLGKNTKTKSVTITELNFAQADFTFKIEKEKVIFTDESKYAESYFWEFGDEKSSTEQNPSHIYNANKTFTVTLTVSNSLGKHSISKNLQITEYVKPVSTNNNLIFVADNGTRTAHALDASSGNIKWSSPPFSGHVPGAISLVDNVLYFGDDQYVYAVDAISRNLKWRFKLSAGTDGSPLVHNGVVYVGVNHNRIYAINAADGTKKWEFNTASEVKASPIIHNQILYVGSMAQSDKGGTFYAINIHDGSLKWQRGSYFGSMSTKAVIVGNNVYFGGTGGFHILNSQTGDLVGHHYFKVENTNPIVENNMVYAVIEGKEISSINLSSGHVNWTQPLNATNSYSSPLFVDNNIYVCGKNSVLAISKSDGRKLWEYHGTNFNGKNTTYASGIIYAVDTKGSTSELVALDAKTGKVIFLKTKSGKLGDLTILDKNGNVHYPATSGQ